MARKNSKKKKRDIKFPEATTIQIDNLLRFLNRIELASDVVVHLGLGKNRKNIKIAENILIYRDINGPFIYLDDLYFVESLDLKTIQLMLDNSVHSILNENVSARHYFTPVLTSELFLNLFKGRILFSIDLDNYPKEWGSVGDMPTLVDFKMGILEDKHKKATNNRKSAKTTLDNVKKAISEGTNVPESTRKEAEDGFKRADEELKAVNREIDSYNEAIGEKDLKKFWTIVKKNIEEITIVDLEKKKDRKAGERDRETNAEKKKVLEREVKTLEDEIKEFKKSVRATDTAVNESTSSD